MLLADVLMIGFAVLLVAFCLAIIVCVPMIEEAAPECCGEAMEPEPLNGWWQCRRCRRSEWQL